MFARVANSLPMPGAPPSPLRELMLATALSCLTCTDESPPASTESTETGGSGATATSEGSQAQTTAADGSTGGPSSDASSDTAGATTNETQTSSESGGPDACEAPGRFDVDRFDDGDVALFDDVVFSTAGVSLDLYVPDARLEPCPNRPVLLMVHGGAWVVGQKEWMDARARFHARRGLVVATIDYRKTTSDALCSGDGWNRAAYRAMQDVNAAAQLLVATSAEHAIDPDAIFLYGNSAGAITTLSLALTGDVAIDGVLGDLVASEGALDGVSLHPEIDVAVRALYTQAGAVLDAGLVDPTARPALLLMHSEGDASVPYATGGTAVCQDAPITVYGSSWVADTISAPDDCVALVQVGGATHDLDEVYGERCDAVDPPCQPSRIDDTAARFFSAVMSDSCASQHTFCTATDCELVEGRPREWFTLFP